MIKYIDLSEGQIKILKKVCDIYNQNLAEVYRRFDQPHSDVMEMVNVLNLDIGYLRREVTKDFLKFTDLEEKPSDIVKMGFMELIIIQFIIREWAEDEGWNDLEAYGLINKITILTELANQAPKNSLS
jgi:hypothetical protein